MRFSFVLIRLDILYGEWQSYKRNLVRVKKFCDAGGDWERKNKVKVHS